jgi:predicted protein tyrosine phosphatase
LILNLLDAEDPAHIFREVMDAALDFIEESLGEVRRVLVHCNQGNSRAPAIGLLYLAARTDTFAGLDYRSAHDRFRDLYPAFGPAAGVRGFLSAHWALYCRGHGHETQVDAD